MFLQITLPLPSRLDFACSAMAGVKPAAEHLLGFSQLLRTLGCSCLTSLPGLWRNSWFYWVCLGFSLQLSAEFVSRVNQPCCVHRMYPSQPHHAKAAFPLVSPFMHPYIFASFPKISTHTGPSSICLLDWKLCLLEPCPCRGAWRDSLSPPVWGFDSAPLHRRQGANKVTWLSVPSKVFPQSPPRDEGDTTNWKQPADGRLGKPCALLDSWVVGKPIPVPTALAAPRECCLRQEGGRPDGVGQRKICRHSFGAVAHWHLTQLRALCCDSSHENPSGRRHECKVNITRTGDFGYSGSPGYSDLTALKTCQ